MVYDFNKDYIQVYAIHLHLATGKYNLSAVRILVVYSICLDWEPSLEEAWLKSGENGDQIIITITVIIIFFLFLFFSFFFDWIIIIIVIILEKRVSGAQLTSIE